MGNVQPDSPSEELNTLIKQWFEWDCRSSNSFATIQVNLCQKLLFLHQLTHNMTTDCGLVGATISASEKDLPAQNLVAEKNWTELENVMSKRLKFGTAGIRGRMGYGLVILRFLR